MNLRTALDAPRWRFNSGNAVSLEQCISSSIVQGLKEMGHQVEISSDPGDFGKGQIILRLGEVLVAACKPHTDRLALAL